MNGCNEPIATTVNRLDEQRAPVVVSKRFPKFGHGVGNRVVRDKSLVPHRVDQPPTGHNLAGVLRETQQHRHHPQLDLDRLAVSGQTIEARLHEPVAEAKRLLGLRRRFVFKGHVEITVRYGERNSQKVPAKVRGRRKE